MKEDALRYHSTGKPGKIAISVTKPCTNAKELSLAYSPGVAYPCLEIKDHPEDAYKYTSKGHLVAVMSNGTAVLGLGNIGALAGKPVMEGKGVLFKRFANIDVFDLEINEPDPEKFIEIATALEPTFGGINLEDIKAPECFQIEEALKKRLSIPVFHDDQHGTAIIVAAALTNALEIVQKQIKDVKIVVNGAGAAAIAISHLLLEIGVQENHLFLHDTKGLIHQDRNDLNDYKRFFAQKSHAKTLEDSLHEADVFIGVSVGNLLTGGMIKTMRAKPIIFALANPTPEITPDEVKRAVPDAVIATGRSDFANQVNNVLGFPYIFRGALDAQAKEINTAMKLAAVQAIAELAHEPITEQVKNAYAADFTFGSDYIIPKPFDARLLARVPLKIVEAAIQTGVARNMELNLDQYQQELESLAESLNQGYFCHNCQLRKRGLDPLIRQE